MVRPQGAKRRPSQPLKCSRLSRGLTTNPAKKSRWVLFFFVTSENPSWNSWNVNFDICLESCEVKWLAVCATKSTDWQSLLKQLIPWLPCARMCCCVFVLLKKSATRCSSVSWTNTTLTSCEGRQTHSSRLSVQLLNTHFYPYQTEAVRSWGSMAWMSAIVWPSCKISLKNKTDFGPSWGHFFVKFNHLRVCWGVTQGLQLILQIWSHDHIGVSKIPAKKWAHSSLDSREWFDINQTFWDHSCGHSEQPWIVSM